MRQIPGTKHMMTEDTQLHTPGENEPQLTMSFPEFRFTSTNLEM